jgi:23S rRNA (adenine2503-C2)-methyltransferase
MKKAKIKNFSIDELEVFLEEIGEKKFRAGQIFNWLYNHLAADYSEMRNIPKTLRAKLSELTEINSLIATDVSQSSLTGTAKFLFKTDDGYSIESVFIPEEKRNTLCISTQVGCPLDCKFCATGLMGYKRNLTAGEIVDQYLLAAKRYGKKTITNVVYMGMGEPLLNYKNTIKSLEIFTSELNTALSRNRITISTSGIPKRIKDLADSGVRVKIALSLHSCFEDIRNKIMPINLKYSLKENIDALEYYYKKTKKRITYEYTMLKGINDRKEDVKALTKLLRRLPSKLNIIPFNSIAHMNPGGLSAKLVPTSLNEIHEFAGKLRENNVTVMIRDTQGDDIAAACGQLANSKSDAL